MVSIADVNPYEMIAFTGSRVLEDNTIIFVGTGLPIIASMHAQLTHAPNVNLIFEAGSLASILEQGMPLSVGDTRAFRKAVFAKGLCALFELTQRGYADYAFIGGAQIDMYGNINSTRIGPDHQKPKVRFPGSGGANDFGSFCWNMMMITPQDSKRFAEKCTFITTPGWLQGGDSREKSGLAKGSGPYRVITNMAVMGFEPTSKRMMILSINPGYSEKDVQDNCGFELLKAKKIKETSHPTKHELEVLRGQVDPYRYIIGR